MNIDLLTLIIMIFSTWRLSSLIANEMGPGDVLEKARYRLGVRYDERSERYGRGWVGKVILCQWCNSIWIGIILVLLYLWVGRVLLYILLPYTISAGAILIMVSRPMQAYYRNRG